MNRKTALVIFGLLFGIILGFSFHSATPTREERPSSQVSLPSIEIDSDPGGTPTSHSRPTLDEVIQSPDHQRAKLLSHYLRDADIAEILEVLEASMSRKSPLYGVRWMTLMRALEVDSKTLLGWTRENPHRYIHSQVFHLWAIMDPHAALEASLAEGSLYTKSVLARLKFADPSEALSAAQKFTPRVPEVAELEQLKWEALTKSDVHQALAEARAVEDPKDRERSIEAVAKAWAELDPHAALRWFDEQDEISDVEALKSLAIETIAETQPLGAFSKVDVLRPSRDRNVLEGKVATHLAQQDPDEALRWLASTPKGAKRDHLFGSMVADLKLTPEALLDLVEDMDINIHDSEDQDALSIKIIEGESDGIFSTSREFKEGSATHPSLQPGITNAVLALAEESPKEALEAMHRLGAAEGQAASDIINKWYASDPEAVVEWAAELPEGEVAQQFTEAALLAITRDSAEKAASFATQHDIPLTSSMATMIGMEWARKDPEAAWDWTAEWEADPQQRDSVMTGVLDTIGRDDPIMALQRLDMIEDEQKRNYILGSATRSWVMKDAQAAMSWLEQQPPEAPVNDVLAESAKQWINRDPVTASEWIGNLEFGPRKDQAVVGLLDALTMGANATKDFEAAEVWLNTLNDRELRDTWTTEIESRRK